MDFPARSGQHCKTSFRAAEGLPFHNLLWSAVFHRGYLINWVINDSTTVYTFYLRILNLSYDGSEEYWRDSYSIIQETFER